MMWKYTVKHWFRGILRAILKYFSEGELIEELLNRGYVRVFWNKIDIVEQAKSRDITLTEDQVDDIAGLVERKWDANIGVNWEVLDYFTDQILNEKT